MAQAGAGLWRSKRVAPYSSDDRVAFPDEPLKGQIQRLLDGGTWRVGPSAAMGGKASDEFLGREFRLVTVDTNYEAMYNTAIRVCDEIMQRQPDATHEQIRDSVTRSVVRHAESMDVGRSQMGSLLQVAVNAAMLDSAAYATQRPVNALSQDQPLRRVLEAAGGRPMVVGPSGPGATWQTADTRAFTVAWVEVAADPMAALGTVDADGTMRGQIGKMTDNGCWLVADRANQRWTRAIREDRYTGKVVTVETVDRRVFSHMYAHAVSTVKLGLAGSARDKIAANVRSAFATDRAEAGVARYLEIVLGAATRGAGRKETPSAVTPLDAERPLKCALRLAGQGAVTLTDANMRMRDANRAPWLLVRWRAPGQNFAELARQMVRDSEAVQAWIREDAARADSVAQARYQAQTYSEHTPVYEAPESYEPAPVPPAPIEDVPFAGFQPSASLSRTPTPEAFGESPRFGLLRRPLDVTQDWASKLPPLVGGGAFRWTPAAALLSVTIAMAVLPGL